MMDGMQLIGELESLGVSLSLAIDYEYNGTLTPEIESLLSKLSEQKEAAIDYFLSKRIVPLPDDVKLPKEFKKPLSARMKQISHIFRTCFDMLKLHESCQTEEQFKAAADYHIGKLDASDQFAINMNTVCYKELSRQYEESK